MASCEYPSTIPWGKENVKGNTPNGNSTVRKVGNVDKETMKRYIAEQIVYQSSAETPGEIDNE